MNVTGEPCDRKGHARFHGEALETGELYGSVDLRASRKLLGQAPAPTEYQRTARALHPTCRRCVGTRTQQCAAGGSHAAECAIPEVSPRSVTLRWKYASPA